MKVRLRLDQAADRVRSGDVIGLLRKPIYSESTGIGLRKDLASGRDPRLDRVERQIRPASAADLEALVGAEGADPSEPDDRLNRSVQRRIATTLGTDHCYVADSSDGQPGFMQYLFFSEDNELFQASYSHTAPALAPDEAMVEFLYVAPAARTISFVTECMMLVIEEARVRGSHSVVTFPAIGNRGAMMASHVVGFQPYAVRSSKYRFFRKSTTYELRSARMSEVL